MGYGKELTQQKLDMDINSNRDENNVNKDSNNHNTNNNNNSDNNEKSKQGYGSFVYEYNPSNYFGIKMKNRFDPSSRCFEPSNLNNNNLNKPQNKKNSIAMNNTNQARLQLK